MRFLILAAMLVFSTANAQEATPQARQKARVHIKKARALYEAGKLDQAVAEYEAAFGIFANPDIEFNIGQIRRAQEDRVKALAAYRKYLEVAPDGTHAQEARELSEQMRREIVPEELRPKFDAVKNRYEKYKEEKGGALDEQWAEIDAQVASGSTDGLSAKLESLDGEITKRVAPPLEEEGKKAAVKTQKKKEHKPFAPIVLPPYAKTWWFWTAVGGGAAVVVMAIALGATLGAPQHDPSPTLGILK